ncbi:hypothetical protein Tco_0992912 [Tanacetum coccineum]|uniref:Uncharacterized protein n=1 Tax=Tanacetum coccineum TaxID=301880 RepID=A0ABQ5F455_9ASTR
MLAMKKFLARRLKEHKHSHHDDVSKMRSIIPKLKWRATKNHADCGVFVKNQRSRLRYKTCRIIYDSSRLSEEEADEGEGSGSEEEYDEGNAGYMTQMQGGVTDS